MEKSNRKLDARTINSKTWNLNEIRMGFASTKFEDFSIFESQNQDDLVRIHYGLKGDYRFKHHQLDQHFDLIGGHHNMMYSNGFGMTLENKSLEIETFGIQMSKDIFCALANDSNPAMEAFADKIQKGEPALLSQNWGGLDVQMEQVIRQIKGNQYTGKLQSVFLYAKCLELLVMSAEACMRAENNQYAFIKLNSDKEKLIAARELILSNLNAPLSLQAIATTVGLNTYKLKRGFKELFGETVFAYMTKLRLDLALQMLHDTQKQVAQIAFDLGYATPQHFSNQFKRHFGYSPKSIRKNA